MLSEATKAAIRRATKWLRANPDKHIAEVMAMTHGGRMVGPTHPAAECFCALGRVGRELGVDDYSDMIALGIPTDIVWKVNDGWQTSVECNYDDERARRQLGQICALDYLESLV